MTQPQTIPTESTATATQAAPRSGKLLRLDALRGLAVLLVFVFHLSGHEIGWNRWDAHADLARLDLWPGVSDALYPLTFGWVGVPIFFALSGFVIHLAHRSYERDGVRSYYRRRFWRILPPYLLVLVVLMAAHPRSGEHPIAQFVTHALLVHNFHPATIEGVNSSFWTIAVEAQFYALYPAFMLLRRRFGVGRVLLALGAFNLVARGAIFAAAELTTTIPKDWAAVALKSPLLLWADWVAGAYVAECFLSGRRAFGRTFGTVAFAACVAIVFILSLRGFAFAYGFSFASLAGAIAIDRIAHAAPRPTWPERALVPLGIVGYSFYLLHQPMIGELSRRLARAGLAGPLAPVAWAAVFATIFVASWAMYRAIEVPSQRLGKPRARKVEELTPA